MKERTSSPSLAALKPANSWDPLKHRLKFPNCSWQALHAHTHTDTYRHTHTHTHTHTRTDTDTQTHTHTHAHTHTHTHTYVGFYGLRGLSIGVMVFILYKLYVLLPYTYPTPKLSPYRRWCIYIFPQKNSLCMIYKRFKLWGH